MYNRSNAPAGGKTVEKWDKGDVIGVFVSLHKTSPEENYIRWFKEEKEVNAKIKLVMTEKPLYVVCLLSHSLSVRLHYVGRSFPRHYILNNEEWTEFGY